jgi:imidazolonepropionase-like amidohydrolase
MKKTISRRRFAFQSSLALLAPQLAALSAGQVTEPRRKSYQLINGQWFDGATFRRHTLYSVDGLFTHKRPKIIDEIVDLKNGYVTPPFADAHNHNLPGRDIDATIRQHLRDGIFYVKNPNNLRRSARQLKGKVNTPTSTDAIFANGGLTATGGHPVKLYEDLAKGPLKHLGLSGLEDEGYFIIDNAEDLRGKWPKIMAGQPDFIKIYLLFSEEFERRRDNPKFDGWKGLDPNLAPLIVERAHENGLRVSAHIETATDFHNAVVAGVDEINHLPGVDLESSQDTITRYQIAESDARLAAQKGVIVVTTTLVSLELTKDKEPARLKILQDNQVRNLRLLHGSGVKIAIGADVFSKTSVDEAMNLYKVKAFDNLTLLKMWCENTSQTIFPRRKIGRLAEGYEASFILLDGNPLQDFDQVKAIRLWLKQGYLLDSPK